MLTHHALHTGEADAELVLQQLAHAAQTAVAQMVDIIGEADAVGQAQQVADGGHDIVDDDVLGHQIVLVQLDLLNQILTGVLAQQLLQDLLQQIFRNLS